MFDMIGASPICVRADREVQDSICECLTLPDNLRRTSEPIEVSGLQVRIMSWGFLSFDTERYIQYPPDDSHQLSIVTELEVPSQALTVLIASLSVILGLIAMAIIFVLLYKRGFFKTFSTDDQDSPVPPSAGEASFTTANVD